MNRERLILTFGNLGETFCKELGFEPLDVVENYKI